MSIPSSVGRYRIDRVLGSGAFASVWLGHDDALAAPVAIKVLSGSLLDDLDVRNRFLEEARILRRADSERLVRVHDIGELPDGRPYFVMSYADRGTLADRMRERPLPAAEAVALAEEIAYGVEVVNRLGVIHRDLKPSNVLFQSTPDGGEKLLIADLGLAKAIAHASGAFTLPVGTPGYMSPEQARFGGGLDVRADVYGLGALTYHMLTGRPPGPAPVKVPPSELRVELPPGLDEVVLRAMEVERENRWATAEAFARALTTLRATIPPGSAPNVQGQGQGQGAPSAGAAAHHGQQGAPQQQQQQQGGYGQPPAGAAPQQGEPQQAHGGYGPPQQAGAAHQQGQPPQQGQGGYGPPVPPSGAAGQRGGVPPEPPTAPDSVSQQDVDRTAQVPLPPNVRRQQQPDPEPRTVVDSPEARAAFQNVQPPQGAGPPEEDRTIAMPLARPQGQGQQPQGQQGQPGSTPEGATAIFSTYQEQGGQGGQGRPGGPGPGPGVQQGGPGPQQGGPGPQQGGPGGPSGPGGGRSGRARRPRQATDSKMRKRMIAVAIGAAIVVFALVGGLLLGQIGSSKKSGKPAKGKVPADFVAVADATGKIKAFVPKVWPKLAAPVTWQPSGVGLAADTQSRPVLRATSGTFQQFLSSTEKTPGVFIGLTTDSGQGKLPPARAAVHPQCTKGPQESYTSPNKNLTGTITRFTACKTGTPAITEVGLTDKGGKFGAWVRVKETDGRKATNDILNNLTLAAP